MAALTIVPLQGLPEVAPGDDLATLILAAADGGAGGLQDGDILVIAQKIVSKAEGRQVALADVEPTPRALAVAAECGKDPRLVELVLRESTKLLRIKRDVLIVRHRLGYVMAQAGIDQSNLPGEAHALLLPENPDASAARLRDAIRARRGIAIGLVVSDSFGRPWRLGTVNIALGAAGLPVLVDRRGERDRDGRIMRATLIAQGDAIASAAGLVMGEGAEGIPAAIVRGLPHSASDQTGAALLRPLEEDMFQ